jgi:hypothetical protein
MPTGRVTHVHLGTREQQTGAVGDAHLWRGVGLVGLWVHCGIILAISVGHEAEGMSLVTLG